MLSTLDRLNLEMQAAYLHEGAQQDGNLPLTYGSLKTQIYEYGTKVRERTTGKKRERSQLKGNKLSLVK